MRSLTRAIALLAIAVTTASGIASAQDSTARADTTHKNRLLTPADIKAWNGMRQTSLSSDGKWFAWVVAPTEGDATLYYRSTASGAKETKVPVGNAGGSVQFSGDGKWMGYLVNAPRPRPGARGTGGRGTPPPAAGDSAARGAAQAPAPPTGKFVLVNLATGDKKEFERIRRFSFNTDDATYVVMQSGADAGGGGRGGPGAGGEAGQAGGSADLLLYNLGNAELFNMGRVKEYAFNKDGDWLAYTMDTPDRIGNGVQVRNMKTGAARSIESSQLVYSQLAWVDSSRALSVMRARIDTVARDTSVSIEAFTSFGADGPAKRIVFDPSAREDFPRGWKLAGDRAPRYADDMSAIFFSVREAPKTPRNAGRGNSIVQPGAPGAGGTGAIPPGGAGGRGGATAADSSVSLILWHYKDTRLQSQQIVQEASDRATAYAAEYRIGDDRFIQLADTSLKSVIVTNGDKYAYGIDTRAYDERASYTGRNYQDVYSVDLKTGKRTLLEKQKLTGQMSAAPDGHRVLTWGRDANWWILDIATGDSVNITRGVPTSFANMEDDHNNLVQPPAGTRGWSLDGNSVLLSDGWDIWKVPTKPGAGTAVNLTVNGRKDQIRYQTIYRFDTGRNARSPALGVDLSKPLYIGTYGEWTKKAGLSRVDPGQPGAKSLVFDDYAISIQKARDADTYLYTRGSFTDYPNYWVFGPNFSKGEQLTDVNPQQKNFAWSSGTRLINYTTDKGDKLQGALYLPADYQPGKKYPMLVTIYEKRSQGKNQFVSPSDTRAPDPTLYTNRGYVVFDPDIVYKINDPGMSAVWAVVPAVKAAIATGIVDPKRVGLWGHSWGGYQTAFLVTQTDIFAAAIAGAPLTNMVSMYASVYWNSGGSDAAIFESSQGRFKGNFIDNYDAYIRNSPVFHADKVHTPLMILANDKDGAVDYNQGITYYNTLRQLGKEVILLEYVGENHGLAKPANMRDYAQRMSEYFDHYLKGAPAPDWLTNGIPRIKMDEHLKARADTAAKGSN